MDKENESCENKEFLDCEEINDFDQEIENKAKKFNMTAIQVRSLLYVILEKK